MNIWSEKKQDEKIDSMHNNPAERGLVAHAGDWPWSSWRFYCLEDSSILAMDRLPWTPGAKGRNAAAWVACIKGNGCATRVARATYPSRSRRRWPYWDASARRGIADHIYGLVKLTGQPLPHL